MSKDSNASKAGNIMANPRIAANQSDRLSLGEFKYAAYVLLEQAGGPLHYKELTARAIRNKLLSSKGKNPAGTMYALLLRDIARNGRKSLFAKLAPAHFSLSGLGLTMTKPSDGAKESSGAYSGKAAEYRVLMELTKRGYRATPTIVDDGIDVHAFKDSKHFELQVKWRNAKTSRAADARSNAKSDFRYESHFNLKKDHFLGNIKNKYFVLILNAERERILVMSFAEMQRRILYLRIKPWKKVLPVRIVAKRERIFLGNMNDENDVSSYLDNWSLAQ
jgi:hypothetical protein